MGYPKELIEFYKKLKQRGIIRTRDGYEKLLIDSTQEILKDKKWD